MTGILNLEKLNEKEIIITKIKILMKNLGIGRIMKSSSYLTIFMIISQLGLKETKPNFIIIWQRIFYLIKKPMQ
jgi:hypothetical protein